MFLLGLVDDIYNLPAKFKLLIQISIATLVFLLGVRIDNVPMLGEVNGILSYIITLLWIVGISNAINFIDGVDGLAGSVIAVNSITLAIIAVAMVPPNPISALIGFILAGSVLAFLTYNFNPAKIFMGDSGALFSGFLLATLSITGVMKATALAILLPFEKNFKREITFCCRRRAYSSQVIESWVFSKENGCDFNFNCNCGWCYCYIFCWFYKTLHSIYLFVSVYYVYIKFG